MTGASPPAQQLDRYLQTIAGDRCDDELLEIRYATSDGRMRRRFISIRRLDAAARAIRSLSSRTDVYCGVLLRSHRAGGRDAVTSSHLAFVEIDVVDALDRLKQFARTPTMIVSSGIICSRCGGPRAAAGDRHRRHVADGAEGVDAGESATTYDINDLRVVRVGRVRCDRFGRGRRR